MALIAIAASFIACTNDTEDALGQETGITLPGRGYFEGLEAQCAFVCGGTAGSSKQ